MVLFSVCFKIMLTLSCGDLSVDEMFKMPTKLSLKERRMAAIWIVVFHCNAVIQNIRNESPYECLIF